MMKNLIVVLGFVLLCSFARAEIWRTVDHSDNQWEAVFEDFQRSLEHHLVKRSADAHRLEEITEYIRTYKEAYEYGVKTLLEFSAGVATLSSRIKSASSVIGKVDKAEGDMYETFTDLHDIMGFRLITITVDETNNLNDKLNQLDDPNMNVTVMRCYGMCRDAMRYRSTGYRRIHLEILFLGKYAEVQIGTPYTDYWSNWNHDIIYKGPLKDDKDVFKYQLKMAQYFYVLDEIRNTMPTCPQSLKDMNVMEALKTHLDDKSADYSFTKMARPPNGCFYWPDIGSNHVGDFPAAPTEESKKDNKGRTPRNGRTPGNRRRASIRRRASNGRRRTSRIRNRRNN